MDTPTQTAPITPVEAAPQATPEAPKEEFISPKYQALAREQKAVRRAQQELKAREEALKSKEQEYQTNYVPIDKIKSDPFAALTNLGISYDDIVKAAVSQDPQSQAIKQLDNKYQSLEQKIEQAAKAQQDNQTKQLEAAFAKVGQDAQKIVDEGTDYEVTKVMGAHEGILELVKATWNESGEVLSTEDAAKQVEEHLFNEAIKLAAIPKVQKHLASLVQTADPTKVAVAPKQPAQIKTLTNVATTTSSKPLTAMDRKARAIAAFRGQPLP